MRLLLETIRIDHTGARGLERHNARLNRARRELFCRADELDLRRYIRTPHVTAGDVIKCRVVCGEEVLRVEYQPYRVPVIRSLTLVRADDLDYHCKYEDRTALERLRARRGAADDVLLVRDGLVTDTSFSNVLFDDGARLVTPAQPLLAGTRRQELLECGLITEAEIRSGDISLFRRVILVNSLLGLEEGVSIPVDRIGAEENGGTGASSE